MQNKKTNPWTSSKYAKWPPIAHEYLQGENTSVEAIAVSNNWESLMNKTHFGTKKTDTSLECEIEKELLSVREWFLRKDASSDVVKQVLLH